MYVCAESWTAFIFSPQSPLTTLLPLIQQQGHYPSKQPPESGWEAHLRAAAAAPSHAPTATTPPMQGLAAALGLVGDGMRVLLVKLPVEDRAFMGAVEAVVGDGLEG